MTNDQPDIFVTVIEAHKGIVYKIANLYCVDAENRKDLIQEILLQLWKSFDSYHTQYKYSTWIYKVALNVAISFYRKEKTRAKFSNPFPDAIFNIAGAPEPTDTKENTLLLRNFLNSLKELDKALMLLYLEEKTHREIAEIIGISETNVATKINRIKTLLQQKFLQSTT